MLASDDASPRSPISIWSPTPIGRGIILPTRGHFLPGCAPGPPSWCLDSPIGRFSIALRQLAALQGHPLHRSGISVWMGATSIVLGVLLVVAGLFRYRKTRDRLDQGSFEPAGFVLDLVTVLTVLFGLVLAGYLIYIEKCVG